MNQKDEEFGLQRFEHLLLENAARPLPEIFDALIAAVCTFGPQKDDRTVLLIRILARTPEYPLSDTQPREGSSSALPSQNSEAL